MRGMSEYGVGSAGVQDHECVERGGIYPISDRVIIPAIGALMILVCLTSCDGGPAASAPTLTSPSVSAPDPNVFSRRIVGYFTSWSIYERDYQVSDIPAGKLTHINYAFANIKDTGECMLGDSEADERNFYQLKQLKQEYPHLKTLISVGGWTWSGKFSDVALTEESRRRFVTSCIALFLVQHEGVFDGIDIDWEYPVSGGLPGNTNRPEDKHNYTLLMQEFRRQLDDLEIRTGQQYLLTIAAPAACANIELNAISQYLDWINIMTYDFHGGWENTTNFNAPLYSSSSDPSADDLYVHATVQSYLDAGAPADKIVLGAPFYGRGWQSVPEVNNGLYQGSAGLPAGTWESGVFDYRDLAENYVDQKGYTRYWHDEAKSPWLYNPSTEVFISYDDVQSMGLKADYVNSWNLGGVMFWELSGDDGSLLSTLYSRLH